MAEFAPYLLSPSMLQKIEQSQQNYGKEIIETVNAQHAQVANVVCVCVPSLPP
jgi:hypothetical protein